MIVKNGAVKTNFLRLGGNRIPPNIQAEKKNRVRVFE